MDNEAAMNDDKTRMTITRAEANFIERVLWDYGIKEIGKMKEDDLRSMFSVVTKVQDAQARMPKGKQGEAESDGTSVNQG